MIELAINDALNDPARNILGQHGPRCLPCSGLGSVLNLPVGDGRATRQASRCSCKGSGLDLEGIQQQTISGLIQKLDRIEKDGRRRQKQLDELMRSVRPGRLKMSRQTWSELISWATADGTAVANTTTEAILMPNITIPANYMQDGRVLRGTLSGKLSTTGTPTMIWAIRWGGVGGTILAQSEAITNGSGVANVIWTLKYRIVTRANGSSGSVLCFAEVAVHTASGTVLSNLFGVSGFDAPAAVSVDLTADTALAVTADWSAASASNTLTGMESLLESLN